MLDDTDAVLLSRYEKERAEDAFTELVRRHIDGVYSAALRRLGGDAHLAEDVTQTVFTALARQSGRLSHHAVLTGWLYVTTRNHAVTLVRRERRRTEREQKAQIMNDVFDALPDQVDWVRIAPILDSLLDQLSAADRNAVLLRFVDGRAFAEIGAALRLSEDAARMRVDRALGKLRALLARKGVTSSTAALALALTHHAMAAAPAGMVGSITAGAIGAGSNVAIGAIVAVELMSTTKSVLTIVAILAALTSVGTAVYQNRELQRSLVELETSRATEHNLIAEQQAVNQSLKAISQQKFGSENSSKSGAVPWNPIIEGNAFLARHPEIRDTLVKRETALCWARYGPLIKSLNLSKSQADAFIVSMLKTSFGFGFSSGPSGEFLVLKPTSGDIPSTTELQRQISDAIGDDGYQKFGEFMRNEPARNLTAAVAGALSFTDSPLEPQQAAQLIAIVSSTLQNGKFGGMRINWDAVLAQASSALSLSQITVLTDTKAQYDAQSVLNRARYASSAH